MTWNHPFGKIPLLTYTNDIKTYPVLLIAKASVKSSSILHLDIRYSLIGKTYLNSFSCNFPSVIERIETFPKSNIINGNTLCITINQVNETAKRLKGIISIDFYYKSGKKPYLTDIPSGWIDFESSFSISSFPFPSIIGKDQYEIKHHIISKSGTYSISFIDNYF